MKEETLNNHYNLYKKAKDFEDFATKSYYFEKNVDRVVELIEILNEKLKINNNDNYVELNLFCSFWQMNNPHIYWTCFNSFLDISAITYDKNLKGFDWLKPISLRNFINEEYLDDAAKEFLKNCSIENLLMIFSWRLTFSL